MKYLVTLLIKHLHINECSWKGSFNEGDVLPDVWALSLCLHCPLLASIDGLISNWGHQKGSKDPWPLDSVSKTWPSLKTRRAKTNEKNSSTLLIKWNHLAGVSRSSHRACCWTSAWLINWPTVQGCQCCSPEPDNPGHLSPPNSHGSPLPHVRLWGKSFDCIGVTYLPQSKEEEHHQTASEVHLWGFPTVPKAVGPNCFVVSVTDKVTKISLGKKGLCLHCQITVLWEALVPSTWKTMEDTAYWLAQHAFLLSSPTPLWFLGDRFSLCSPSCPVTGLIDQAGLKTQRFPWLCFPGTGVKGVCVSPPLGSVCFLIQPRAYLTTDGTHLQLREALHHQSVIQKSPTDHCDGDSTSKDIPASQEDHVKLTKASHQTHPLCFY